MILSSLITPPVHREELYRPPPTRPRDGQLFLGVKKFSFASSFCPSVRPSPAVTSGRRREIGAKSERGLLSPLLLFLPLSAITGANTDPKKKGDTCHNQRLNCNYFKLSKHPSPLPLWSITLQTSSALAVPLLLHVSKQLFRRPRRQIAYMIISSPFFPPPAPLIRVAMAPRTPLGSFWLDIGDTTGSMSDPGCRWVWSSYLS